MPKAIPDPSDYKISPSSGFLPEEPPLERLSDPYYGKWESVLQNLQALILSRRLREIVLQLPVLSTKLLKDEAEWRRAYFVLSFIAHGYVWGGECAEERVPPSISKPYKEACRHLKLPTVATYAAVCLWNWRPLFCDEPIDDLSNLATLSTFTGSMDESWFYLVSVAIEARGAPAIPVLLEAMSAVRRSDALMVTHALQFIAERIDELTRLLNRMHEHCDPHIFYHHVRPFLAGSKGKASAGLPNGVLFDTGAEDDEFVQYDGGSNGQSSLIQFFDIALGVEHRTLHFQVSSGPDNLTPTSNFIQDMRNYMPSAHRRFLEDVAGVANIRGFVNQHSNDEGLVLAFNACLAMLKSFRDQHIQIVSRYIVVKSREARPGLHTSLETGKQRVVDLPNARKSDGREKSKLTGTGGTLLIPFLKQARDETTEGLIDQWTNRLVDRTAIASLGVAFETSLANRVDKAFDLELVKPEVPVLVNRWNLYDTEGGICHC